MARGRRPIMALEDFIRPFVQKYPESIDRNSDSFPLPIHRNSTWQRYIRKSNNWLAAHAKPGGQCNFSIIPYQSPTGWVWRISEQRYMDINEARRLRTAITHLHAREDRLICQAARYASGSISHRKYNMELLACRQTLAVMQASLDDQVVDIPQEEILAEFQYLEELVSKWALEQESVGVSG